MMIIVYEDTAMPVGLPVRLNGEDCYEVGIGEFGPDYSDDPEHTITFASQDAARWFLEAITAVLTPYIEDEDRSPRVPQPEGWTLPDEAVAR